MKMNKFKLLGASIVIASILPFYGNAIGEKALGLQKSLSTYSVDFTENNVETRKVTHNNTDFFQAGKQYIDVTVDDFNQLHFNSRIIFKNSNNEPVVATIPVELAQNEIINLYITATGNIIQSGSIISAVKPGNYKLSFDKGYGLSSENYSAGYVNASWQDDGQDHLNVEKIHLYTDHQIKVLETIKSMNTKQHEDQRNLFLLSMMGILTIAGIGGVGAYSLNKRKMKPVLVPISTNQTYKI